MPVRFFFWHRYAKQQRTLNLRRHWFAAIGSIRRITIGSIRRVANRAAYLVSNPKKKWGRDDFFTKIILSRNKKSANEAQ